MPLLDPLGLARRRCFQKQGGALSSKSSNTIKAHHQHLEQTAVGLVRMKAATGFQEICGRYQLLDNAWRLCPLVVVRMDIRPLQRAFLRENIKALHHHLDLRLSVLLLLSGSSSNSLDTCLWSRVGLPLLVYPSTYR